MAASTALIIGGTGPSGPDIAAELLRRGYAVTLLHRGLHEPDDVPHIAQLEHIHADPHFGEPLAAALANRSFDLVVATYGRLRTVAEVLEHRCGRFIGIVGNPVHAGMLDRRSAWPEGMRILANEQDQPLAVANSPRDKFALKVAESERAVLSAHARGGYSATLIRYPLIYGRRAWAHYERGVVRRLLAGRRKLILVDGGLGINSRSADRNAAALVGCVVDRPEISLGRVFQCADDVQYSLVQWTQLICRTLGVNVEYVSVPFECARPVWPLIPLAPHGSHHTMVDTTRAREDLGYKDAVAPVDALADLVGFLAQNPRQLADAPFDPHAEDVVMGAYADLQRRLGEELKWEPISEGFRSDYEQPGAPAGQAG
jgi:nucleoside-diphosphate-sugar epimerase